MVLRLVIEVETEVVWPVMVRWVIAAIQCVIIVASNIIISQAGDGITEGEHIQDEIRLETGM